MGSTVVFLNVPDMLRGKATDKTQSRAELSLR